MQIDVVFQIFWVTLLIYVSILVYVRLVGLRSFAQMTAVDFAVTVAIGTVITSTILPKNPSPAEGIVTLGVLFFIQWSSSKLKLKVPTFKKISENQPLLIMEKGKILEHNLNEANMTKEDLFAKLREANVIEMDQVQAVVFESAGDVSVLHSDRPLEDRMLKNVRA